MPQLTYNYDPASSDNTPKEYEVARIMETEVAEECGKRLALLSKYQQKTLIERLKRYGEDLENRWELDSAFLNAVWRDVKADTWIKSMNCPTYTGPLWWRAMWRLYTKVKDGTYELLMDRDE